jgi:hypothetical protein
MAQKAVSSEGRGLRVREYGPDASRSHNMIIGGKRTFGGLMGRSPGGTEPHLRACRARPSGGLVIGAGMAYRGKPSGDAKGDFLGGTHSVRPPGKAGLKPRHCIPAGCVEDNREAKRINASVNSIPMMQADGAPFTGQGKNGLGGQAPGRTRGGVLSQGSSPRLRLGRRWPFQANLRWTNSAPGTSTEKG